MGRDGDALVGCVFDLRLERLYARAQLLEGARDLRILACGGEVERDGALALEQGQLDVVGEEEQLRRVGSHCGGRWCGDVEMRR